jgi:hypothetical protein
MRPGRSRQLWESRAERDRPGSINHLAARSWAPRRTSLCGSRSNPGRVPAAVWPALWDGMQGPVLDQELVSLDGEHSVPRYLRSLDRSVAGYHWSWAPAVADAGSARPWPVPGRRGRGHSAG